LSFYAINLLIIAWFDLDLTFLSLVRRMGETNKWELGRDLITTQAPKGQTRAHKICSGETLR
jgi:hypothetical protein